MPWALSPPVAGVPACSLPFPSPFPLPGKAPRAVKLNQALLFFTLKMLLSLNCGFKWLLKRATRALKAARWQASHAEEPALAASVSHSTAGGTFVFSCTATHQPHGCPVRGFPHRPKIGFCVWWDALLRVDSEISQGFLEG